MTGRLLAIVLTGLSGIGILGSSAYHPFQERAPRKSAAMAPASRPAASQPAAGAASQRELPLLLPDIVVERETRLPIKGISELELPRFDASSSSATRCLALEVIRRGAAAPIPPDQIATYRFLTGDAIKLRFRLNSGGFIYVMNEDCEGKRQLLLPSPRIDGGKNSVTAGTVYTLPIDDEAKETWWQFTGKAGPNRLLVLCASERIESLHRLSEAVISDELWEREIVSRTESQNRLAAGGKIKRKSFHLVLLDPEEKSPASQPASAPQTALPASGEPGESPASQPLSEPSVALYALTGQPELEMMFEVILQQEDR